MIDATELACAIPILALCAASAWLICQMARQHRVVRVTQAQDDAESDR